MNIGRAEEAVSGVSPTLLFFFPPPATKALRVVAVSRAEVSAACLL